MSCFFHVILDRVFLKNRNMLGAFLGDPGVSKSYSALRFAQDLNKIAMEDYAEQILALVEKNERFRVLYEEPRRFDMERDLIFWPKQFFEKIRTPEEGGTAITGQVKLGDEWHITSYARKWQSEVNQAIVAVLTTFRRDLLVGLFTLPDLGMMDSHNRPLLDFYVDLTDQGLGNVYELWKDHFTGKIGRRIMKLPGGDELRGAKFEWPDQVDLDRYERDKKVVVGELKRRGLLAAERAEGELLGPVIAPEILAALKSDHRLSDLLEDGKAATQDARASVYVRLQEIDPYRELRMVEVDQAVKVYASGGMAPLEEAEGSTDGGI
jgi:hypothetical protein